MLLLSLEFRRTEKWGILRSLACLRNQRITVVLPDPSRPLISIIRIRLPKPFLWACGGCIGSVVVVVLGSILGRVVVVVVLLVVSILWNHCVKLVKALPILLLVLAVVVFLSHSVSVLVVGSNMEVFNHWVILAIEPCLRRLGFICSSGAVAEICSTSCNSTDLQDTGISWSSTTFSLTCKLPLATYAYTYV